MADQKEDPLRPVQDKRGFFMLPQTPMESGYYTYGLMDKKPTGADISTRTRS